MKNTFLTFCVLSVSLFACKKDTTPEKMLTSKVPLNIRMQDFLQQVETLPGAGNRTTGTAGALRDSVLATKVRYLYYCLYDGDLRMRMMQQDANDPGDFGNFYDTVAPGTYTVLLAASSSLIDIIPAAPLSSGTFEFPTNGKLPELFYKLGNVTVTDGSAPIEFNMTLDRIVGNLQVNILDMPQPGTADTSVSITISPEAFTFFIDPGAPYITPFTDTVQVKVDRISLNTFSSYVLNTVGPLTVTIHYVDPITGPQTKIINNVSCYKNRRTILSGYLYGSGGISVTLADSWSGDNHVDF